MRQERNSETGPPSLAPAPHGCQVTSRVFTRHALLRLIFTPENKPCVSAALCAGLGRLAFTPLHGLLSAPASAHPRFL